MAKLFYTLKEAAEKLKMSEMQVRDLIALGQLQEFRDRDRIMLKVDQVDLLTEPEPGGIYPVVDLTPQIDKYEGSDLLDVIMHIDADEGSGLLDLTSKSDDTKLGQDLLEDFKEGNGQVLLKDERPATAIDRFAHFTRKEMSTLRTALMTLRVAGNQNPEVEELIDELHWAGAGPVRKRGLFARLFGRR